MARKRFIWQIFPAFLFITLLSLLLVSYYVTQSVEEFHLQRTEAELVSRARLLAPLALQYTLHDDREGIQQRCERLGADSSTRITLILRDGAVIADSHEAPQQMENHAHRPEIQQALVGKVGASVRFSHTLNTRMMYVALPATPSPDSLIVRVAIPVTDIGDTLHTINSRMIVVVLGVTLLAAILSWLVSRRVVRPLADLKTGAERFARGNLDTPLPIPESEEFAKLTEALNLMALQIASHIQAVEQQRNEQEAILSSMAESVLAIDTDLRVITINKAASTLLEVDLQAIKGRLLLEAVRCTALHAFARQALESDGLVETEIDFSGRNNLLLRAQGTVLRDGSGHSMGAVIVLDNITRLRQLEEVRQDFVANVSHELKTPITSIKGFVETLLDDADSFPEHSRHFLGIIEKQANRLDAIIEDLLALSRLEQGAGRAALQFDRTEIQPAIEAAIELCQHRAASHGVEIQFECPPGLAAPINGPLLEQGLVNLVDNAIKYSGAGKPVLVRATTDADCLIVEVVDEGAGIPANEQDRIFERFYRLDKARSSELGGTGLGLSIVKHIAQVHGGTVTVSSAPGDGSTFTVRLPR